MLGADIEFDGISHTYFGATVIAIISCVLGIPACTFFLKWWNRHLSVAKYSLLMVNEVISGKVALSSAFIDTYSHILLDSNMHADLESYFPFQIQNNLLGLVDIDTLHFFVLLRGFWVYSFITTIILMFL